jgi:hypothetical protein
MKKVVRGNREFWVGMLKRRNSDAVGLVVYDPDAKASIGDTHVVLYELEESAIGEFRKEVVRQLVGPPDACTESALIDAVDAYCRCAAINPHADRPLPRDDCLPVPNVGPAVGAISSVGLSAEFRSAIHFLAQKVEREGKGGFLYAETNPVHWDPRHARYCMGILDTIRATFAAELS